MKQVTKKRPPENWSLAGSSLFPTPPPAGTPSLKSGRVLVSICTMLSFIFQLSSFIFQLSSLLCYLFSALCNASHKLPPPAGTPSLKSGRVLVSICIMLSFIFQLSSFIFQLSSLLCYLFSALCNASHKLPPPAGTPSLKSGRVLVSICTILSFNFQLSSFNFQLYSVICSLFSVICSLYSALYIPPTRQSLWLLPGGSYHLWHSLPCPHGRIHVPLLANFRCFGCNIHPLFSLVCS